MQHRREGSSSNSARACRNLLYGVIALQNDFVTREQLVAAFDAWVHDKTQELPDLLERAGALTAEDRGFLDRLIEKFQGRHGGDVEKSLAALSPGSQIRPALEQLEDSDLQEGLRSIG